MLTKNVILQALLTLLLGALTFACSPAPVVSDATPFVSTSGSETNSDGGANAAPTSAPVEEDASFSTSSSETETQSAYPVGNADSDAYPVSGTENVAQGEAYPADSSDGESDRRFDLTEPFSRDSNPITGTGIPGAAIKIVSVSFQGESLGLGVVEDDGTFAITISRPLDSRETLGIMLADEALKDQYLDAVGATDIPLIGLLFDIAQVTE